jgi:hypothetical protein
MSDFIANWNWPQWTAASIYALALFINLYQNGKPKTPGVHNGALGVIGVLFALFVLYSGGFWTPTP